jgi:hypothetical protein
LPGEIFHLKLLDCQVPVKKVEFECKGTNQSISDITSSSGNCVSSKHKSTSKRTTKGRREKTTKKFRLPKMLQEFHLEGKFRNSHIEAVHDKFKSTFQSG